MDPRVTRMARVIVEYSIAVKDGQQVVIDSPLPGEPLALECVRATLAAGGRPWTNFSSAACYEALLREGTEEQLSFISPAERMGIEAVDASIGIIAPTNTKAYASVDSARIAVVQQARKKMLDTFMQRSASGALRWTIAMYPTQASAQDANMSLREYEDFVYRSCLLDEADPVSAWRSLAEMQKRVIEWLAGKSEIRIKTPGTDFRVDVADRTWMNDDGQLNFPGGEVFTAPIENSAQGTIAFTYPGFYQGKEVRGIRLVFKDGQVVDATAETNEDFLRQMLDTDPGARRLGEFAIGTNEGIKLFTKNVLFDEKIGGTFHVALGAAYPDTGGLNESSIHWDIVCDLRNGGEITADGETLSRNGQFVL